MRIIANQYIERLCIIDDDETARDSYVEAFYNSAFEAFPQNERVENVDTFLSQFVNKPNAVISDHQLKKKSNYFPINGAQVISMCYQLNIPSVLVTIYPAQRSEIRKFRKNIPVILNPDDLDEDTVAHSLEVCINEFNGKIRADRKLWRTLVRITAIEESLIYILIPGWDTTEAIPIGKDELPNDIKEIIEEDKRLHVQVNIGCEKVNDLYFENWEIK